MMEPTRVPWYRSSVAGGLAILAGGFERANVALAGPVDAAGSIPMTEWSGMGTAIARTSIVLVLMVGGLYLVLRRLKQGKGLFGSTRRSGRWIEVVDRWSLEPRKAIYLVKVGSQFMLIGSSESQLAPLACPPLDQAALTETLDRLQQERAAQTGLSQSLSFVDLLRREKRVPLHA